MRQLLYGAVLTPHLLTTAATLLREAQCQPPGGRVGCLLLVVRAGTARDSRPRQHRAPLGTCLPRPASPSLALPCPASPCPRRLWGPARSQRLGTREGHALCWRRSCVCTPGGLIPPSRDFLLWGAYPTSLSASVKWAPGHPGRPVRGH